VNSLPRVNLLNEKAPLFEFRTRNKGGSKLDGSPAFVLIGSVVPALWQPGAYARFLHVPALEGHTPRFSGSTHVAFVHDHAWSQNVLAFLEVPVPNQHLGLQLRGYLAVLMLCTRTVARGSLLLLNLQILRIAAYHTVWNAQEEASADPDILG
jgi:hypothetical protein